jgi:hypothetical protein
MNAARTRRRFATVSTRRTVAWGQVEANGLAAPELTARRTSRRMTIDTTRIAHRHPPAVLSSGETDIVKGPLNPPRPAENCGKRRENNARSSESKNSTPRGVIVTRYQVSNIEIRTKPVPTPDSTSANVESESIPLEAIPARDPEGAADQVVGAVAQEAAGAATPYGGDDAKPGPPVDVSDDPTAKGDLAPATLGLDA